MSTAVSARRRGLVYRLVFRRRSPYGRQDNLVQCLVQFVRMWHRGAGAKSVIYDYYDLFYSTFTCTGARYWRVPAWLQGVSDPSAQRGLIPRAFDHIFDTVAVADQTRYLIHASFLEIYNEEIRDLLADDTKARIVDPYTSKVLTLVRRSLCASIETRTVSVRVQWG